MFSVKFLTFFNILYFYFLPSSCFAFAVRSFSFVLTPDLADDRGDTAPIASCSVLQLQTCV